VTEQSAQGFFNSVIGRQSPVVRKFHMTARLTADD
jgi:hypothetical protein